MPKEDLYRYAWPRLPGKRGRPKSTKPKEKLVIILFKCSPEERAKFKLLCAELGISMQKFLRRTISSSIPRKPE